MNVRGRFSAALRRSDMEEALAILLVEAVLCGAVAVGAVVSEARQTVQVLRIVPLYGPSKGKDFLLAARERQLLWAAFGGPANAVERPKVTTPSAAAAAVAMIFRDAIGGLKEADSREAALRPIGDDDWAHQWRDDEDEDAL
jgi:hypothetical protein